MSNIEIITTFESVTGIKLNYEIGPRRVGDVEQVWGDVTKSAIKLKWKTELSIENMMLSAWEWEKYIANNPI